MKVEEAQKKRDKFPYAGSIGCSSCGRMVEYFYHTVKYDGPDIWLCPTCRFNETL